LGAGPSAPPRLLLLDIEKPPRPRSQTWSLQHSQGGSDERLLVIASLEAASCSYPQTVGEIS
jgi:hypothetical protein